MSPKPITKSSMNLRSRKKLERKKKKHWDERRIKVEPKRRRRAAEGGEAAAGPRACPGTTCQLCTLRFVSIQECAVHILEAHVGDVKLCPRCSRAFLGEEALAAHVARHTRRSIATSCAHCPLYFTTPALLERHQYERHEAEGPGAVLARYFPHFSAHLNVNFARFVKMTRLGQPLYCSLCQHAAAAPAACLAHARACGRDKLVCDTCANVYRSKQTFVQHIIKNNCKAHPSLLLRRQARLIQCKKCKQKFADRTGYHTHWDSCSVSNRCSKCDVDFDSLQAYNAHCAERHRRSLRTLNCTYCRMEFISEKTLVRHIRQHERYSCLRCGRKFRTPKPLLLHIKTSHPDTEPYRCVPCALSFREGLHFKLHIKSHDDRGYIRFDENHYVTYTEVPPPGQDAANASSEVASDDKANISKDATMADDEMFVSKGDTDTADDTVYHTEENILEEVIMTTEVNHTEEVVESSREDTIVPPSETEEAPEISNEVTDEKPKVSEDAPYAPDATEDTESESETEIVVKKRRRRRRTAKAPQVGARRTGLFAEKTFRCTVCGRRTGNLDSFNRHVTEHFRAGAKQCPRCAKIFRSAAHLARHAETEHKERAPGSRLHSFLKERAARKMAALSAARRASARPARAAPPPTPFRVRLRRVAAPTVAESARGGEVRVRTDGDVTVTECDEPGGTFGDLTVQRYVESFQPDPEDDEKQLTQTGPVKLVTLNKSLKVRSVSSRDLKNMFSLRMKRYREPKPAGAVQLALPVPYRRDGGERARVTVGIADAVAAARTPSLDFGERRPPPDIYDADYFETDEHSVAQVEVLSTPAARGARRRARGGGAAEGARAGAARSAYVLQLTDGDPSTADIEKSLAEVCAKLDGPKNALHIGQLTTQAPYYKIINVKKAKLREHKLRTQADIQRRFEEIKIGAERMVPVNPLQHLLKKAKEKLAEKVTAPTQNINIIPVQTE